MRTGVRLIVAGALALADRERAAVVARSLEHAERDRVDVGDGERAGVAGGSGELGRRLETAEEVRLLEDGRRCALCGIGPSRRVDRAAVVRHLDHLEAETDGVGLDDPAHLRVERLGEHDLRAAGHVLRDEARVGSDGRAVVTGRVRDVHPGQLADRRLILEDRLEHALAQLGLVRRVRRQELAALEHRVDDGRNVVVVDPGSEERELLRRVDVARCQLLQVPDELGLRERGLEVERTTEPHAGGDVAEELVDRRDPDRLEHRLPVVVGQGKLTHEFERTALYASSSSSVSTSEGSLRRIRSSQPSP